MADLTLEPYAVVQRWSLPGGDGRWEGILAGYLQTVAQRCAASGKPVIGHIKALALLPDKTYLRISVVAAELPANVVGSVPPGCTGLELTLNVLVYGLERAAIQAIVLQTAAEIAEQWNGTVSHQGT